MLSNSRNAGAGKVPAEGKGEPSCFILMSPSSHRSRPRLVNGNLLWNTCELRGWEWEVTDQSLCACSQADDRKEDL